MFCMSLVPRASSYFCYETKHCNKLFLRYQNMSQEFKIFFYRFLSSQDVQENKPSMQMYASLNPLGGFEFNLEWSAFAASFR